jgi:nucleoside-diphosphate-sugar epimerase
MVKLEVKISAKRRAGEPIRPLRLLIIGGSGFLSGTLARLAVSRGYQVTIVTRGQRPVPEGVQVVTVDRRDHTAFARKFTTVDSDWDLVIDTIAYTPEDTAQDIDVFAGRTSHFVLISTDFVYDPLHRQVPQTERATVYAAEGYGGLKRQAELVLTQSDPASLPWTILRPSHIYGLGSWLGCLPLHGRDPHLIEHIQNGRSLALVGGGHFLQHPVFAPDLAKTILSVHGNAAAISQTYNIAGPDIVTSQDYYRILGKLLKREVIIHEIPTADFVVAHPEKISFCCDRVYDLSALKASGLDLPSTPLAQGFQRQLDSLTPS